LAPVLTAGAVVAVAADAAVEAAVVGAAVVAAGAQAASAAAAAPKADALRNLRRLMDWGFLVVIVILSSRYFIEMLRR